MADDPKPPADEYDKLILGNLQVRNALEYELGDTLDIKTSIALVVIIFLATQSGGYLAVQMPRHWHNVQVASVLCLIAAGILAVYELFPRTYKVGWVPEKFITWVTDVRAAGIADGDPDPEGRGVEFIRTKTVEQLRSRFRHNRSINAKKSWAVEWTFYLTMVVLILNLATLAAMTSGWRF